MKLIPKYQSLTGLRFLSLARLWPLVLVVPFLASTRVGAADLFLKLATAAATLPGESSDPVFQGADGWNAVSGFEWTVTADTSWIRGGGVSVGRPEPQSMIITRKIDSASSGILAAILVGSSLTTGELVVRDTSRLVDKDSPDTVLRYEFTGIFITSIKPAAVTGDKAPEETIAFVFKTLKMTYRPVTAQGTLGDPMMVIWDVPAGTVGGP